MRFSRRSVFFDNAFQRQTRRAAETGKGRIRRQVLVEWLSFCMLVPIIFSYNGSTFPSLEMSVHPFSR